MMKYLFTILLALSPYCIYAQFQFDTIFVETGMYVTDINIINEDTIFVCSGSKMLRTTDGGTSWDTLLSNSTFYQSDFFDFNNGYAVSPMGYIIKTSNAGTVWDTIQGVPSNNSFFDVHMISDTTAIVSSDNGLIYKVTPTGFSVDTLYDLMAGGSPLTIKDFDFETPDIGFGGGVTAGLSGLARTVDGGNNWEVRATNGFLDLNFDEVACIDSLNVWGIENSPSPWEHISYSNDGGFLWNSGFMWFSTAKIVSLDFSISGFGIVAQNLELLYTIDSGMNWSTLLVAQPGFSGFSKVKIVNDSIVYIGGRDGIYKVFYPLSIGVSEHLTDLSNSITIFPNPIINNLELKYKVPLSEIHHLSIFDLHGREIFGKDIKSNENVIDLTFLKTGLYNLRIKSDYFIVNQKFVKL